LFEIFLILGRNKRNIKYLYRSSSKVLFIIVRI